MAKLEASFKPLSSFITLKCHNYIYPFIQYHNNSNHHAVINWHLDPSTLSWLSVKQSKLPFPHRDQCQKQYRLLNYLLSQRYTLETVQSILGVGRGSKSSQNQPMNHIMVKLIVSVMNSNTENTRTRLIFWKHLEHIFVTFIFHKLIRFLLCLFDQQVESTFYIFYKVKFYEISASKNFVIMFLIALDKFKI